MEVLFNFAKDVPFFGRIFKDSFLNDKRWWVL
jgi:hypothetical protein